MSERDVFVVAAKRTPIGSFNGSLAEVPAHILGATAMAAALEAADIPADAVDETILGQVLTAGAGMNPARQAATAAGLPDSAPALGINQVCGSGLRAVALASQQIRTGDVSVVIAGGQENMSRAPHVAMLRKGRKLGNVEFVDTVMSEGLSDALMGVTAENIVRQYGLSRDDQDRFALLSQQRAAKAAEQGRFDAELASVRLARKGEVIIDRDEYIRHDATIEALAKLKPAFEADGTVTAGNASGINDGAASVVLMSGDAVKNHGAVPLARIAAYAHTGIDPQVMGLGPISASRKALDKAGWTAQSVGLWEVNEAFAAQSLAVIQELELDREKVNVNGGAIALGHPIGASGARVLVTLLHEMARRDVKRGVATLCIGGGMGIALCAERD